MEDNNLYTYSDLVKIFKPIKVINRNCFIQPTGFSIDSRTLKEKEGFIALKGKFFDGHRFVEEAIKKKTSLVVSQIPLSLEEIKHTCVFLVEDTYKALESLTRYIRKRSSSTVIGITGSVGKSTTKEMLAYILESKFPVLKSINTENNFLGVTKTLLRLKKQKIVILELGTNSPGEIRKLSSICDPTIGIITFIKPVHTEGLLNLKGIFKEKISLVRHPATKVGILNYDDPILRKVSLKKKILWFGKSKKADIYAKLVELNANESKFMINDKFLLRFPTPVYFYIYNALASLLTSWILGVELKEAIKRLEGFDRFLPMRMQKIETSRYLFINDAYNANPYSLKEAIKVVSLFSYPKIAILGDMLELGKTSYYFHTSIAEVLLKNKFCYILTLGEKMEVLHRKLKRLGFKRAFHFSSHQQIIDFIKNLNSRKKYLIFLKGSRQMVMEKILEALH